MIDKKLKNKKKDISSNAKLTNGNLVQWLVDHSEIKQLFKK